MADPDAAEPVTATATAALVFTKLANAVDASRRWQGLIEFFY
jgi:hypothetical protein